MNIKRWTLAPLDRQRAAKISSEYGVSPFLGALLDIRGFTSHEQLEEFFGSEHELSDPFLMKDMDKAVERIRRAVDNFEKIAVYGDYDVDGVTATSILFSYLEAMGADVCYYIPMREGEGYGMNKNAVRSFSEQGVQLIVTVDNGISSVEEIELAKELGMDVVVTDHHRPHELIPDAVAVVDAHRKDDESPFKDFCGAGVVLKLLIAMEDGDADFVLDEYADLAALGTIGDVVSLMGENRTIVKRGLASLEQGGRPGLDALIERCLSRRDFTANSLAFSVIPRINATGRMGAAQRAVQLLITEDEEEASELAETICGENETRRRVEREIEAQASALMDVDPDMLNAAVVVVSGKNWHHGVIGIVASRIVDRLGKPCIVISEDGDIAKGSGRSVEGFPLFDAISSCRDILERCGGHPMAAGVTLKTENIELFRERINEYAAKNFPKMPAVETKIDLCPKIEALTPELPGELEKLEPYGEGNPSPVFGLFGMKLTQIVSVGENGDHLRLICEKDGKSVTCMRFGMRASEFPYKVGNTVDLAVTLSANEYRGQLQLTIRVEDTKLSSFDPEKEIHSYRIFENIVRHEHISKEDAEHILPNREELATLYRLLQKQKGNPFILPSALEALNAQKEIENKSFNLGKLLLCLEIFEERELAEVTPLGEKIIVSMTPRRGKTDIFASPVYERVREYSEM